LIDAIKYYDLKGRWRRARPHLEDDTLRKILARDFNKYTRGTHWRKFDADDRPRHFENIDWDYDEDTGYFRHRGREPAFWAYTKHGACHWLVNFNLRLAQLTEPNRNWRIVTSKLHSTVWDGETTLFEFNFLAFGIPPDECFSMADEIHLAPGEYRRTG
jgi:hypothetical protein